MVRCGCRCVAAIVVFEGNSYYPNNKFADYIVVFEGKRALRG